MMMHSQPTLITALSAIRFLGWPSTCTHQHWVVEVGQVAVGKHISAPVKLRRCKRQRQVAAAFFKEGVCVQLMRLFC